MSAKAMTAAADGRSDAPGAEIDLTALAEGILDRLQRSSPRRLSEIIIMRGLRALGDPEAVQAALEEILGSSWAHTSGRVITLIVVAARQDGPRLVYFVRDNGDGFESGRSDHFFMCLDKFAITPRAAEDGRPLDLARRAIGRMGGRLWAEPAAGQGVIIYFTLGGEARHVA